MAEEASHPGPEPSSELSQLSDITDPYHLGEPMDVVDDDEDRDDRDSDDDDDDDDDADTDTNTNAGTDIVLETTTCWTNIALLLNETLDSLDLARACFLGLGNPNDDIVDLPLELLQCHGRRMRLWCCRRIWELNVGNMKLKGTKSILGGS